MLLQISKPGSQVRSPGDPKKEDQLDQYVKRYDEIEPATLADIRDAAQEIEDWKRPSTTGVVGMSAGGTMRKIASIPQAVFTAARVLWPELPQKELVAMILKRYPQYRVVNLTGKMDHIGKLR